MEVAVSRNYSKGVSNKDPIHSTSPGYLLCFVLLCLCLPESSVKAQPTWTCHSSTRPLAPQSPFTNPVILFLIIPGNVFGFLLVDIQEFLRGIRFLLH